VVFYIERTRSGCLSEHNSGLEGAPNDVFSFSCGDGGKETLKLVLLVL
jgi:hypothetical protein